MINILMNGCNGKMGQVITRLSREYDDLKVVAGITRQPEKMANPYPVYDGFDAVKALQADVVLDFSSPGTLPAMIKYCLEHHVALVTGTTGLTGADHERLKQASATIPVFVSANMSYGMAVFMDLVVKAAAVLDGAYDIEILEKHHNEKKDAPSGTALMIADEINKQLDNAMTYIYDRSQAGEKRRPHEIGISSIRGGTIKGEHTIYFAGTDEVIEIKHSALSRDIFGRGALRAVRYIVSKDKGLYDMKSMLKELI